MSLIYPYFKATSVNVRGGQDLSVMAFLKFKLKRVSVVAAQARKPMSSQCPHSNTCALRPVISEVIYHFHRCNSVAEVATATFVTNPGIGRCRGSTIDETGLPWDLLGSRSTDSIPRVERENCRTGTKTPVADLPSWYSLPLTVTTIYFRNPP